MPKETFRNLSDAKKHRIFLAAVKEFASRRFSEASINQIVKTAKIPRGSFYQYFNDKEDIFLYMFTEIMNEKRKVILSKVDITRDVDFLEAYMLATAASYEFGRVNPEYARISMLMEMDDSELIIRLRTESTRTLKDMIERDRQRGLVKAGFDPDLVVDMLYTVTMMQYFWTGIDGREFLERVEQAVKVIREGIMEQK